MSFPTFTKRWNIFLFTFLNLAVVMYFVTQTSHMESDFKRRINKKCHDCHKAKEYLQHLSRMQFTHSQNFSLNSSFNSQANSTLEPVIYVITPTYRRATQHPDLTRLAQTLMNVKQLHWIVVEDSSTRTDFVADLLKRSHLEYTHLNISTPAIERKHKVRGCAQRNAALTWIKDFVGDGVIYFADDDNAYDIRLFSEIRNTKKVGLLPTGNLQKTGISSPVVKNGKIVGFVDVWKAGRKFPVEMASMSINVAYWLDRGSPLFDFHKMGYLETRFLEALNIKISDIEPKAKNCTMILTWHTNTVNVKISKGFTKRANQPDTNIPILLESVVFDT